MSESTYNQRYATTDTQTAGAFAFDTISAKDYAVSKIAFGTLGSVTYVDASNGLPVAQQGTWNITNVSGTVSLPTGAATSLKQDTGNTSLSSIDGKLPALGQALAAASVPIVLTAAQITTLTPPAAITGFATESTLSTLNGKVTACNTGAVVLAAGTAAVGKLAANDGVDIGDVTINNASGASAVNIQDGGNSITVDGTVAVSGTVTVDSELTTADLDTGAGTDTRAVVGLALAESGGALLVGSAHPLPISGTVAATQSGTWNIATLTGITNVVHIDDNSGTISIDDGAGSITVDYATTGSGNATGALRVELANNGTGVLATLGTITNVVHVDDNSGSITVDGTIAATQSGTWNVGTVTTLTTCTTVTTVSNVTGGTTAHDGAGGSINPLAVGLYASAAAPSDVSADNDIVRAWALRNGAQCIQPTFAGVLGTTGNGISGTGVQRVTLASDSTGQVALAAGTNGIGKLTANSGVTIGAVEIASAQTLATVTTVSTVTTCSTVTTVSTLTGGGVASGSSDSGNPHKIGAVAHTAAPTAVTDGQRVNLIADKVGKLVTAGSIRDLKVVEQTTITSSTSETTIAAQVASTFKDLYGLIITNTSATGTKVTIKDSTSGTTRAVIWVPANETRGFMLPESGGIPQATVNTNWTATCGTSVASIEITALTVKNI